MKVLLPGLFLFCVVVCGTLRGEEHISFSGKIYQPSGWTNEIRYALRSHEAEAAMLALQDPRGLILQEQSALVSGWLTGRSHAGLPIVEVADLLPERWEQPWSAQSHYSKGFAAWSGYGREAQFKDYASVPFSFDRAYEHDMGIGVFEYVSFTNRVLKVPLWISISTNDTIQLRWPGTAGVRYDLQAGTAVTGPYQVRTTVISEDSSDVSVFLPSQTNHQFFRLLIAP